MNNLAQYLAYTQPRGTGQSVISPLAQRLAQQPMTHWAQLIGNLAQVGVDAWGRKRDQKDQASSIAEMLAGGANQPLTAAGAGGMLPGGGATSGGAGPSNPEFTRMRDLLMQSPELAPIFQGAALEKQFPEYFGEEPELVEITLPDGSRQLVPKEAGLKTGPAPKASYGSWNYNEDTAQYERTNPQTGELETRAAPQGAGGGFFSAGAGVGGGADPMAAISMNETGGNPNAAEMTSPKGAVGQHQIMPATGREIAQALGDKYALALDDFDFERYLRDPRINKQYGEFYYNQQLEKFGTPELAAAAYNAGPGRVEKALAGGGMTSLPEETQGYVQKFNAQTRGAAPQTSAPPFVPPVKSESAEAYKTNLAAFEAYVSTNNLYDQLNPQQKAEVDRVRRERERDLGETKFSQANTLRDEYITATKPLGEIVMGYSRMKAGAQDASGAGDLAIVYGYIKMLDPTSVVREGELALAGQTGSVPEMIVQTYNNIIKGERLAPEVRERFISMAERLAVGARARADLITEKYTSLASGLKIDPSLVVVDLTGSNVLPKEAGKAAAGGQPAPTVELNGVTGTFTGEMQDGKPVYATPDGRRFVVEE